MILHMLGRIFPARKTGDDTVILTLNDGRSIELPYNMFINGIADTEEVRAFLNRRKAEYSSEFDSVAQKAAERMRILNCNITLIEELLNEDGNSVEERKHDIPEQERDKAGRP